MSDIFEETSRSAIAADERQLPALTQANLDEATLEQLFTDIAACTKVLEVTAKVAPKQLVPQRRLTLADAHALIRARSVRGVQIRYEYEGFEWWDTIIIDGDGPRVVRIRHG